MVIEIIFDAILNPLLSLPDWLSILIFATFIIIITNLIYKYTLDQKKIAEMKAEMKEIQKRAKEAPNEEKMKHLSEMNEINSKYMMMTMKPMMITMLVVILFIPWLSHNYGDIHLKGSNGTAVIFGNNVTYKIADNSIVIGGKNLSDGDSLYIDGKKFYVYKKNDGIKLSRVVLHSPIPLPFTGKDWGWLAYYFVVSTPLSIILRKVMGVKI